MQRAGVETVDFVEACDRIIMLDEWFPVVARIIAIADECKHDRRQRERAAVSATSTTRRLVCPYCHGARWLRRRTGPDAIIACPHCTTAGQYDATKEQWLIRDEGGVPDPNDGAYRPDREHTAFRVPRTSGGRVDLDAIYRQSRIERGLDPNIDARVKPAAGWGSIGSYLSDALTGDDDAIADELVMIGASADVDDLPF